MVYFDFKQSNVRNSLGLNVVSHINQMTLGRHTVEKQGVLHAVCQLQQATAVFRWLEHY